LLTAWRKISEEHFDFASGPERIEVKSASNRCREHYFSLAQLTPLGGARVIVASIFVERAGGGISLRQLFEDVRERLSDDAAIVSQFDATFYAGLGSTWSDAMDESFDWEVARDSIAFFEAESVPKPDADLPVGVFDVRFRSHLALATPLDKTVLFAGPGLLAAARQR
jgi:hypothetical protein